MKMKKITAFILAVLSVLTIASFAPIAKASAASTVEFVHGYNSYSLDYVVGKFHAQEADKKYGYAYKASDAAEYGDVLTSSHVFKGDIGAAYDIKIYEIGTDSNVEVATGTFNLIEKTEVSSLYYSLTGESRTTYQGLIYAVDGEGTETGKLAGKELGDSFTYPDLTDILISDHFDYNALKNNLTLYYCKPTSSSFSTTTSKSFTLDQVGTYSYYVLAKDPTGTAMETIDTDVLTRKEGSLGDGWYNDSDELIVPVFSFYFANVKAPEITIDKKVEEGFIGLTYQDASDYITIVGNNEAVQYELWYSESDLSAGKDDWASTTLEVLEEAGAVEITEDEDVAFNTSTLSFTPNKKGSYYVRVVVADDHGEDTAVTYAINVLSEFSEVKYDTQFLKYNWVSIMFLGIALLSLIGIILLIFIKPKEEKEEEVTVVSKK